ncbi:MAG: hypothetical protein AAF740_07855 [Bacteroidota bacterium]
MAIFYFTSHPSIKLKASVMMKTIILCLLLFVLFSSHTCKMQQQDKEFCKEGHRSVEIVNNSDKVINYIFYWRYPDSLIGNYNPYNNGIDGIAPNSSFVRGLTPHGIGRVEVLFDGGRKEWVHIFDADSLRLLNWDTVRNTERGLLERRLIDLEYLQENDFKIIYSE